MRCPPMSGGAARCCSCAARAIPPAPCCRSTICGRRWRSPTRTTSSSRATSATPSSIATRPRRRRRCSRPRWPAATIRFERCVVFHRLSKRSSVPGLRSGFVAGDPAILKPFLLYRTYHGCAMPVPTQIASDRGLERRCARRGESRAVPREVRAGIADPGAGARRRAAGWRFLSVAGRADGRRNLHARTVRDAESDHPAGQLPRA